MRATLIGEILLAVGLCVVIHAASDLGAAAPSGDPLVAAGNPCLHDGEGHLELLEDVTRYSITSTTSASDGWRSRYGLTSWPRDSVKATTDSAVCAHIAGLSLAFAHVF